MTESSDERPSNDGWLKPGFVVDGYEIIRKIGEGGMGAVWEARHGTLNKRVAIKTLLPVLASDHELVTRFVREGRAIASIEHPNVVNVMDVGVTNGVPYLVMEYISGEPLADLLARETRLSPKGVANIAVPILCALGVAHDHGIIHRDVKPENILLATSADGPVTPMLLDFGVSKVADEPKQITRNRAFLGTPEYMSLEQINSSGDVDGRTDVYAMGVVLYECLTGVRPFESESLIDLLRMISEGHFVPLNQRVPELPPELVNIVHTALAPKAHQRFSGVRDLARALFPFAGSRVRAAYGEALGIGDLSNPKYALSAPPNSLRPEEKMALGVARTISSSSGPSSIPVVASQPTAGTGASSLTKIAVGLLGLIAVLLIAGIYILRPTEQREMVRKTPAERPAPPAVVVAPIAPTPAPPAPPAPEPVIAPVVETRTPTTPRPRHPNAVPHHWAPADAQHRPNRPWSPPPPTTSRTPVLSRPL